MTEDKHGFEFVDRKEVSELVEVKLEEYHNAIKSKMLIVNFLFVVGLLTIISAFFLIGLPSCKTIGPKTKGQLDEQQSEEYFECVTEGGEYNDCWCHAKHGDDEIKVDICNGDL